MKNNNRLPALWVILLSFIFVNVGCKPQTTTSENIEVQVYDSTQVEVVLANALKVEEMGKPMITKNDSWILTTKYYKVTVALDKDNHLIQDPNGKKNESIARNSSVGTCVVSIGCEMSCQRHDATEGCIILGCESNQKGRCSPGSCGTCMTSLKCRPIKSGLGIGGGKIMF
jgi:hypothetical protein